MSEECDHLAARRIWRFAEGDECQGQELLELFREQLQVPYVPFPDRRTYYKKRNAQEEGEDRSHSS